MLTPAQNPRGLAKMIFMTPGNLLVREKCPYRRRCRLTGEDESNARRRRGCPRFLASGQGRRARAIRTARPCQLPVLFFSCCPSLHAVSVLALLYFLVRLA